MTVREREREREASDCERLSDRGRVNNSRGYVTVRG